MEDARLDPAVRPVNDQRRRDAALVHPSLVEPERRVRQIRPRPSVAAVGVVRTGLDVGRVADAQRRAAPGGWRYDAAAMAEGLGVRDRQALGARAVVRQEEQKRVRQGAGLGERRDDTSDAAIHPVDLGGICLHADELPRTVRRLAPRRLSWVPAAQGRSGRHDPFGHEAFESRFAQLVPAGVELAAIPRNVLGRRVQRPVWRSVRRIEEEGTIRVAGCVRPDELLSFVGDGVGVEEPRRCRLALDVLLPARERRRAVVAAAARQRAEEPIEAAPRRPGVGRVPHVGREVPLAAQAGGVAGGLEDLRDGQASLVERTSVPIRAIVAREDAYSGLVRVQAREHRRARWAAARRVVEAREPRTRPPEAIQSRGRDLPAEAAEVGVTHVVGNHDHDVGFGRGHVGAVGVGRLHDLVARGNRLALTVRSARS